MWTLLSEWILDSRICMIFMLVFIFCSCGKPTAKVEEVKIPTLMYDKVNNFNEGLASVQINGKWQLYPPID